MNDYFETTHHLKSLMPKQSVVVASISVPKSKPKNKPNPSYTRKFKGKEHNRERWENRIESYKNMDLSKMYNEVVLIDWDYVESLKKSSKCPYCNLGIRTTRDHFIPTYYRKGIFYQNKKELSKEKLIIIKCCKSCNHKKGNLLPSEWLKEINIKVKAFKHLNDNDKSHRYYLNVKENLMNILRMP